MIVTKRLRRGMGWLLALSLCGTIPILPIQSAAVGLVMLMHGSADHAHRISVQVSSSCSDLVLAHEAHASTDPGIVESEADLLVRRPACGAPHGDHVVCLAGVGEGLIPSAAPGAPKTPAPGLVTPLFASGRATPEPRAAALPNATFCTPLRALETIVLRI